MKPPSEHSGWSASPFDASAPAVLFGAALPVLAAQELRSASLAYERDAIAERHLRSARLLAPRHPAVLIGHYRYYFYKHRLPEALTIARLCLLTAASDNAFDPDWRMVSAEDAEFGSYDAASPRFFLFTLKAYAYLQMRLGHLEEGRDAAAKVLELDPTDKVGVRVLLDVLDRVTAFDDD